MKKRSCSAFWLRWAFLLCVPWMGAANAAEKPFPNRQIELVVPYSAGGTLDLMSRVIADEASRTLGAPMLVLNKPGGDGVIAGQYVARAKPDGYTLLVAGSGIFVILPATKSDFPFKVHDFSPVARIATSPVVIVVRKDAPWKTVEQLVDHARKNPGKLTCGTSGTGTNAHFAVELLKMEARVDLSLVPFKGGGPTISALLGGHVDSITITPGPIDAHLKSGELRGLVITSGSARSTSYPDIPTFGQKGYAETNGSGMWGGIFAPKAIDRPVLERISAELGKATRNAQVIKKLAELGFEMDYLAGDDFTRQIEKEMKQFEGGAKKAASASK